MEHKGRTIRPFLDGAKIAPRQCSQPLQRRIVDFASEASFCAVPKKFQEHYGFELCPDVIRRITLGHADKCRFSFVEARETPRHPGVSQLICEADGGMVPIVTVSKDAAVKDKRKTRQLSWQEARLCFSRDITKNEGIFRATLKSVEDLGDMWFSSAVAAGMGQKTEIHCLGDGALWIQEQASRIFGVKASYLVDFYHVSEYLSAASIDCEKDNPKGWFKRQQESLKQGNLYLVLQELEKHLYPTESPKESITACYRYLTNRLTQLDYLGAILDGLSIGSGEIESGHRHVVQKRMKKAGSWWKVENAEAMLQLLTLRSSDLWSQYWSEQKECFLEAV